MSDVSRLSSVWAHFTEIQRGDRIYSKCHLCFFELSGQLAANAKKHLSTRHDPTLLDEANSSENVALRTAPNVLLRRIRALEQKACKCTLSPILVTL